MVKRLSVLSIIILLIVSCKEEKRNDYVTVSGLIANNSAKNVIIFLSKDTQKRIIVEVDGTFKDTFRIDKTDFYRITDGKNKSAIHLANGDEIHLQYDHTNFLNTVEYSGLGFETSKYFTDRNKLNIKENLRDYKAFYELTPEEFEIKISRIEKAIKKLLESNKVDSVIRQKETTRNTKLIEYLRKNHPKGHNDLIKYANGKPSPKFLNYENFKGGTTSLDDFKGKIVYIDVWATWCGPCKREIPHLQKLEKDYEDKNIVFVSISVDNGRGHKNDKDKAKEAWEKMIKEKEMSGVQLYADKAWGSDFIKEYGIRSIPRFILIDTEGNIVNADAPRPSDNKLRTELDKLLQ